MLNIAFMMSGLGISGGTNVIFEHAIGLANRGHQITLVYKVSENLESQRWHRIFRAPHPGIKWVSLNNVYNESFDVAVATFWSSMFNVGNISAKAYVYFVQSIESRFYPQSDYFVRALVEATYEFEVGYVTEATWIVNYLDMVRGRRAHLALNGISKSLFSESGDIIAPRRKDAMRILVEGPVDADFKNIPDTVRICAEATNSEIWLLTSSQVAFYQGVDLVFSRVPIEEVSAIYRSCDVLVKLSFVEGMFGPPLEMFHCGGTTIVYDVTGFDEYIVHEKNGLVAATGDRNAVADYLKSLEASPQLLQSLKAGARETAAAWPSWPQATEAFETAVVNAAADSKISQSELLLRTNRLNHLLQSHFRDISKTRQSLR